MKTGHLQCYDSCCVSLSKSKRLFFAVIWQHVQVWTPWNLITICVMPWPCRKEQLMLTKTFNHVAHVTSPALPLQLPWSFFCNVQTEWWKKKKKETTQLGKIFRLCAELVIYSAMTLVVLLCRSPSVCFLLWFDSMFRYERHVFNS